VPCRRSPIKSRALRLAQARGNRYADTAALFQALGGAIAPAGTAAATR